MKLSDIEIVIGIYIKEEVLPHIPTTLGKFAIATGSAMFLGRGEALISKHMPMLKTMGVVGDDGDIDIDMLYDASKEGLEATGGKVDIRGMIFNQSDLDKLYSMLKQ